MKPLTQKPRTPTKDTPGKHRNIAYLIVHYENTPLQIF